MNLEKQEILLNTQFDQDTALCVDKAVEALSLFLPYYRQIVVSFSYGKNGEQQDRIVLSPSPKEDTQDGEELAAEPELTLPLTLLDGPTIGEVRFFERTEATFSPDAFCFLTAFPSLIPDPYFLLKNGTFELSSNACAKMLHGQIPEASEFGSDDRKQILCAQRKWNGSDLLSISVPILLDGDHNETLVCVSDSTAVRSLLKEVLDKATIIKEVHHRVKNNLQTVSSLLELQIRRSQSFMVEKALVESINRISSIALVHEELSKRGENSVDMKRCIHNIMAMILQNMVDPNKSIKGEIRGQQIYLNSSQASSVSLCVTELLQNCAKHAFVFRKSGNIIVTLHQTGREVTVLIEDDGVGFSAKKLKGHSLGLQIVRTITAESLQGTFKLDSHTYGAIAEIKFEM